MSIDEFKELVLALISTKTAPRSIPPVVVGNAFNDLADIVNGLNLNISGYFPTNSNVLPTVPLNVKGYTFVSLGSFSYPGQSNIVTNEPFNILSFDGSKWVFTLGFSFATNYVTLEQFGGAGIFNYQAFADLGGGTINPDFTENMVTDNAAALYSARQTLLPIYLSPNKMYWCSAFQNPEGAIFQGDGDLVIGSKNNPPYWQKMNVRYGNEGQFFGLEYLSHYYRHLTSNFGLKVCITGDSTIQGAFVVPGDPGVLPLNDRPHKIIEACFKRSGLRNPVTVTSSGRSGANYYEWANDWLAGEMALNPDLLIVKYGINDGASIQRIENMRLSLRSGLSQIRGATYNKSVDDLSIIVMMPNSTCDQYGRDEKWYDKMRQIVVANCREFKCAFFDTYSLTRDIRASGGFYMDYPNADFAKIHPSALLNNLIYGEHLANIFLPNHLVKKYTTNSLYNNTLANNSTVFADPITSYPFGESINVVSADYGYPFFGITKTIREANDLGIGVQFGYDCGNAKTYVRYFAGAWTAFKSVTEAAI